MITTIYYCDKCKKEILLNPIIVEISKNRDEYHKTIHLCFECEDELHNIFYGIPQIEDRYQNLKIKAKSMRSLIEILPILKRAGYKWDSGAIIKLDDSSLRALLSSDTVTILQTSSNKTVECILARPMKNYKAKGIISPEEFMDIYLKGEPKIE